MNNAKDLIESHADHIVEEDELRRTMMKWASRISYPYGKTPFGIAATFHVEAIGDLTPDDCRAIWELCELGLANYDLSSQGMITVMGDEATVDWYLEQTQLPDVVAEPPEPPSNTGPSVRNRTVNFEAAVGDPEMVKILKSKDSTSEKMAKLCYRNMTWHLKKSPEWAKILGVTDAAIRQTDYWKIERKEYLGKQRRDH